MKKFTALAFLLPIALGIVAPQAIAQINPQNTSQERALPKPRPGDAYLLSPESLKPNLVNPEANPLELRPSQPIPQLNFAHGESELSLMRFSPNDPASRLPGSFTTDHFSAVPILFDTGDRSAK
jgi:hypothetical protein